ncbi:MAG: serine/threonine-protein kinase [Myxococcota bacterium]
MSNQSQQTSQKLGRYHLLDMISHGGMAEIYRAKYFDENNKEHIVAIKRILSTLADDEDTIKGLIVEARISSLLDHPAVVNIHEFCQLQDEYFMVMELVDGLDLKTINKKLRSLNTSFSQMDAAYVIKNVLQGLDAAHCLTDENGNNINLIHRDISLSNILISWEGEVKLCDFGIAKVSFSRVKTRSGIVKGKIRYMSPEQARGWKLDSRTDIFSAGIVLYELLTGHPPFQAENEVELLKKVKDGHIIPVRHYNKNIHPVLLQIVRKALTIDRLQRYQTAYDFARHLNNFIKKYAPNYSKEVFSKKIKSFFESEIEEKTKNLQNYVLSEVETQDVGVNLIGDNYEEPDNVEFYISPTNLPAKSEDKNIQNNKYHQVRDKEKDNNNPNELSDFLKRHLEQLDNQPQISKQNSNSEDTDSTDDAVSEYHTQKIHSHHLDKDEQYTDKVRKHSNTEKLSKEELAALFDFPDKNLTDEEIEEIQQQDKELVNGDFIFKIKDP